MSEYIPIPVGEAKSIAETFAKSQVIILAWDPVHKVTHTTTFGVSAFDKENAAALGAKLTQAAGCDLSKATEYEDFHKDYDPALYKEAKDLIQKLFTRRDGSDWALQQM